MSKNTCEIKIDDLQSFIPDGIREIGVKFERVDKTQDTDLVRHFEAGRACYYFDILYAGKNIVGYYENGRWETGANDIPRFVVSKETDRPEWF